MNISQQKTIQPEKQPVKMVLIGAIVCLCLFAGGFVAFNNFTPQASPQQAIQRLLEERASALGQKNLERYLFCFSPQYQNGEQGYEELKANASRWFVQFEGIQFSFQTLRLEIEVPQAVVENNYKFALRAPDGEVRNISNRELLELRQEKTGWKIFKTLTPQ
ncbi:MAG: hypothetical protein GY801_17205 [bacterium]|nr:hypothetical protein [bacterium]